MKPSKKPNKKNLKVVPREPPPVVPEGAEPLPKAAKLCPPPAMEIIRRQVAAVAAAQRALQDTVNAVAAGLGIDHAKEKWTFDADRGLFTMVR